MMQKVEENNTETKSDPQNLNWIDDKSNAESKLMNQNVKRNKTKEESDHSGDKIKRKHKTDVQNCCKFRDLKTSCFIRIGPVTHYW